MWTTSTVRLIPQPSDEFPRFSVMPSLTVSPTPNPNSLKFSLLSGQFIEDGMESFGSATEAEGHHLGRALFALRGVMNVFITPQFVTVTKHPAADWTLLAAKVEATLMDEIGESAP